MQPPGLFSITFYTEQFWWKQDNVLILTELAQFCVCHAVPNFDLAVNGEDSDFDEPENA